MKEFLFVYGTLLDDFVPEEIEPVHKRLKYVGAGFINGKLYDLGAFPGAIVDTESTSKVYGKIYELPADTKVLRTLDQYEEFFPRKRKQSLFVRKQVPVKRRNKKAVTAWVYEYNRDVKSSPIITSGDYSKAAA